MNYKIAVLALAGLQAYTTSALPPCACVRNFNPICGSDGSTYSNECKLRCQKILVNSELTKVSDGPCPGSYSPSECICTYEYKPVCGNDGVTYPNPCALRCKLFTTPNLAAAYEGACSDKVKVETPCICTDDLNEVCGTDGKTYGNPCTLNCAAAKDPTVGTAHPGRCAEVPSAGACTCVRNFKPICGTDGKTYSNDCLLNCATASDHTLGIAHGGQCPAEVSSSPPPCTCTRNVKPVCGSDGKTYSNDCLLNCATADDHTLSISHEGRCGDVKVVN